MGLYERYICPHLTERALNNGWVKKHRQQLLASACGRGLELGFGTGLNLPFYPDGVESLDIVDPAEGMHAKARRRAESAPIEIRRHRLSAETLPFDDDTFDFVVSTFTLCTIADVAAAIREVRRVLVADGPFLVFEHVASISERTLRWQNRLNPIQNIVGCGCNLNRDVQGLLTAGGFAVDRVQRISEPRMPALVREHVLGAAHKVFAPSNT